jgi:aminoglycoside N3'-acetyltransferase
VQYFELLTLFDDINIDALGLTLTGHAGIATSQEVNPMAIEDKIRLKAYYRYLNHAPGSSANAIDDWLTAEKLERDEIRLKAYYHYIDRDQKPGLALDDWLKSEKEVKEELR